MNARAVSPVWVPVLVAATFVGAWQASERFRIPSFDWETTDIEVPADATTASLRVRGLKCRHSSLPIEDLLFGRTDAHAVPGYLRAKIFPAPGVGEMEVTYDPDATDPQAIARAVKLDRHGQETDYRVLLDLGADTATPAALLSSLARAFEEQNQELFEACHVPGAARGDFLRLVGVWGELFLEDLAPVGAVADDGRVELAGVMAGDPLPFTQLGLGKFAMRLQRTADGWRVAEADWSSFRAE